MTAKEIYALVPREESKDIGILSNNDSTFFSELNDFQGLYDIKNELITIKYYVRHCFDGRRIWELASVWYDKTPFMIFQRAGREGDDHAERLITNGKVFNEAIEYVRSLLPKEENEFAVSEDKDIPELTHFYSHDLSDFYDPTFVPKYAVGDIITTSLPVKFHYAYNETKEFITVDVKVLSVCDNPYDCYRVEEVNRLIHHKSWREDTDTTFIGNKNALHLFPGLKFEPLYWRLNKNLEKVKES